MLTDDEIITLLQNDVLQAQRVGHPIDFGAVGISVDYKAEDGTMTSRWAPLGKTCPMCAIGARLMGRAHQNGAATDFALSVGRSMDWGGGFMNGSDTGGRDDPADEGLSADYYEGFDLGRRVRDWWAVARSERDPLMVPA